MAGKRGAGSSSGGKRAPRPQGQLRRSQLVRSFGPGALVDLTEHAVIVGGLEQWGDPVASGFDEVREERLQQRLSLKFPKLTQELRFYAPPIAKEQVEGAAPTGITVWQFPEWFVVQYERPDDSRARPIVHQRRLQGGRFQAPDRKLHRVQPIRFVQTCGRNGHIDDIDWVAFAHQGEGGCRQQLWLVEAGTSGDFAEVFVQCDCGKYPRRSLLEVNRSAEAGRSALGYCRGTRPWLGRDRGEKCQGPDGQGVGNRLLLRSASNAYFAQTVSAISIPARDEGVRKAVDAVWADLKYAETPEDLQRERRKPQIKGPLTGFGDDLVWAEIERRRVSEPPSVKGIKEAEIETLLGVADQAGTDAPESDFFAQRLPPPAKPGPLLASLDGVVVVHRLREVVVQTGFTRLEAPSSDIDEELDLEIAPGALSREASWLPAFENHGEGVFLAFKPAAIEAWLARAAVKARGKALSAGFETWRQREGSQTKWPGLPYVMLHSLSHLLITALSLSAGYGANAIRERVYGSEAGYGILLHTGSPDAEGTLGGLVQAGRQIEALLASALDLARLCSNDPICAQHQPGGREERYLHGAACHGCLLLSEPSCERRNQLLDRSLLVATVEGLGAEFFLEGNA